MNGTHPSAGRRLAVGVAVLGILVAGCTSDDGADDQRTEPPADAGPSAETVVNDDPNSAVEAVFSDYWDAVVRAQRGEARVPAELFEGIATDDAIEQNVRVAVRYAQQGIVRVGEPTISAVDVTIDGRRATVTACVDESDWLAELGGETLPPRDEQLKPHPVAYEAIKTAGSWLIGSPVEPEGTITC